MERISGREVVNSNVIWDDTSSVVSETRVPELDLTEVHPLDDRMKVNVLDPYSAVLRLLNQIEKPVTAHPVMKSMMVDVEVGYILKKLARSFLNRIGQAFLQAVRWSATLNLIRLVVTELIQNGGQTRIKTGELRYFLLVHSRVRVMPVRIEVKSWIGK